ncbi:MAG: anthranilate synthase component I family protein [Verrucomicrobiaceae bacterium]|nr:anthranilate synthase component I family protein [Verrucomicrobiaceae bacterium]
MARSNQQTEARVGRAGPWRVAAELSHLPGFFYLDSSSAEERLGAAMGARFSTIAACPRKVLRGNLFQNDDFSRLRAHHASRLRPEGSSPEPCAPGAGLYGYVGYDGDFVFGEYDDVLVFDHVLGSWKEWGDLLPLRRALPAPAALPDRAIRFRDNLDKTSFCDLVARAQDYIAAGDIYQVNLSHRFSAPLPSSLDPFSLYTRLREQSPAPFASYTTLGEKVVMSSSPEQFLSLSGRLIQTRPIKGTRPRFRDRERDEKSAYDLITSPKEIAELIMITDLERNDLGQVCEFGSVAATELLKLERYAQVFHLVSTVEGTLREGVGHLDALLACFPGGSITGAPKKRAREIIAELEPSPRGLYTGAIGCLGFNGESRFSIAIRTLVAEAGELHFHVGAGIVADSVPVHEWEETLHKAAGIFQACGAQGS